MINNLSQEESIKILSEQSVARLGCVLESGEPYIVPVNYLYKDGSIIIHSLPGLKIDALRANAKACVQVDEVRSFFKWRSAIAFGEFEEITNAVEREEVLSELTMHFEKLTPVEAMVTHTANATAEMVLFRISIKRITGMSEH